MDRTDADVSVVLTDDDDIERLNAEWRGVEAPTDVLSFPLWEPGAIPDDPSAPLGDIVISVEYAEKTLGSEIHLERVAENLDVDAGSLEWTLEDEIEFLFIHGLLHLLGHDHAEPAEERRMRSEERRLWLTGR